MHDAGRDPRTNASSRASTAGAALESPLLALARERLDPAEWRCGLLAHGVSLFGYNAGDYSLVLLSGLAKVWSTSRSGHEVICTLALGGDVLDALLPDEPAARSWNLTALTDCDLLRIRCAAFAALLNASPAASTAWLWSIRRQHARLRDRLFEFGAFDARARVAAILLDLAQLLQAGEGREPEFDLPVTRPELAAVCGISREALSKALRELRRANDIAVSGRRVCLRDVDRLADLAEWQRPASPAGRQ